MGDYFRQTHDTSIHTHMHSDTHTHTHMHSDTHTYTHIHTQTHMLYDHLFSVKGSEGCSVLTSPYLVRRVRRCLKVFSPTFTQYGQCHMELALLIHTHTHTQPRTCTCMYIHCTHTYTCTTCIHVQYILIFSQDVKI